MMKYSIGFCFSFDKEKVVLIKKEKPAWQKGRLNGVGGKIELGETAEACMIREFQEETGVETSFENWTKFAIMQGRDWQKDHTGNSLAEINCYVTINDFIYNKAATTEKEEIQKWNVMRILCRPYLIIPNLSVLLPLALCTEYEYPINLFWSQHTLERVNSGQKD